MIQFGDKITIDGDGFQAEGEIHNQTYKAFYTIKNEKEKLKLLKKMPYLKIAVLHTLLIKLYLILTH